MKRKLTHIAGIVGLVVGSLASSSAFAQTTANGPYYAVPAWDQTLPSSTRFIVLSNFALQAVLDRETALVWERFPAIIPDTWFNSLDACARRSTGGRKGWRLPSVHELASLVDTAAVGGPVLPAGHPFQNIQSAAYWGASIRVGTAPWVVNFSNGSIDFVIGTEGPHFAWCVRGGQNHARDY